VVTNIVGAMWRKLLISYTTYLNLNFVLFGELLIFLFRQAGGEDERRHLHHAAHLPRYVWGYFVVTRRKIAVFMRSF
jgi:hypothetical protein